MQPVLDTNSSLLATCRSKSRYESAVENLVIECIKFYFVIGKSLHFFPIREVTIKKREKKLNYYYYY